MRAHSEADADLRRIHAELTTLWDALASLRDSLPSGEAKANARRYANNIEGALQRIERLIE